MSPRELKLPDISQTDSISLQKTHRYTQKCGGINIVWNFIKWL